MTGKAVSTSPVCERDAGNYSGKVLLLACGALAREILDMIEINNWRNFRLECLPAKLHLYPDRIPAAVEDAVQKFRDRYDHIFIVYADCGTGGLLQKKCESLGVEMIEGPHCYAFFDGLKKFTERAESEIEAFYLTDFLVRQFDAFVWKALGLNSHPELLDMYFGNYSRLIYLAQTEDECLDKKARQCAQRLGLEYERRFTGYGDLGTVLGQLDRSS